MVRKKKKPTFINYVRSAQNNTKKWEDHLNKTYPIADKEIKVRANANANANANDNIITLSIGEGILEKDRVKFNDLSAYDFYYSRDNKTFKTLLEEVFDLSKLPATTRDYALRSMPEFILFLEREVLYRDFKPSNLNQEMRSVLYESYHKSKTDYYGYVGFTPGAIKYIKDPVIKQFAMDDLINREHPIVDKMKALVALITKADEKISKQEDVKKKAQDKLKKLQIQLDK